MKDSDKQAFEAALPKIFGPPISIQYEQYNTHIAAQAWQAALDYRDKQAGDPKVLVKEPGKFKFQCDDVTISGWGFKADGIPTRRECLQAVLNYLCERCLESDGLDTPAWNDDGIEIREITSGVIEVVQKSTGEPVRPHFTNFSSNTPSHLRERLSAPAEPAPAVAVNEEILTALKAVTQAYADLLHSDYQTKSNQDPASKDEDIVRARAAIQKAEAAKGGV